MPPDPEQASTPITLTVGDVVIPATLNTTLTARRFKDKLPFTASLERYTDDYCGTAPPLQTDAAELQAGWQNGDISYADGWFAVLFDGQERSRSHTGMMIIGRVDDGYLESVRKLDSSIAVTVDLVH